MTEMKKNVPEEQEEISQSYYLEAPERGFWYPAVKEAGQIIKKGELLGQLKIDGWNIGLPPIMPRQKA